MSVLPWAASTLAGRPRSGRGAARACPAGRRPGSALSRGWGRRAYRIVEAAWAAMKRLCADDGDDPELWI